MFEQTRSDAKSGPAASRELPAKEFLSRLTAYEQIALSHIASVLCGYLDSVQSRCVFREPFALAGVGGILRRFDPSDARDIDLVVSGLANSVIYQIRGKRIDEPSFKRFGIPYVIFGFLKQLTEHLGSPLPREPIRYSLDSSIPFEDFNRDFQCESGAVFRSYIEPEQRGALSMFRNRGWLGVRAIYPQCRPFDIIFALGTSVDEWIRHQEAEVDQNAVRALKRSDFPYSFLTPVRG